MFLDAVWWFRMTLHTTVFLIGIPGNAIIIRVYTAKRTKVSAHVLIIGLAVADLSVCLWQILAIFLLFPTTQGLKETNEFFCRMPPAIDSWARNTSTVLTSVVAVDRYLAVCRPTFHRKQLSARRMRNVVVAFFVFCSFFAMFFIGLHGVTLFEGQLVCLFTVPLWVVSVTFCIIVASFLVALILIIFAYTKIFLVVRKLAKLRPGNVVAPRHRQRPYCNDNSTARAELGETSLSGPSHAGVVGRSLDVKTEADQQPRPCAGVSSAHETPPADLEGGHDATTTSVINPPSPASRPEPDGRSPAKIVRDQGPAEKGVRAGGAAEKSEVTTAARGLQGGAGEAASNDPAPSFHRRTTLMLFLTSVVFVVTVSPQCLVLIFYPVFVQLLESSPAFRIGVNIAIYLSLVNHMINPVIYSALNPKFRQEMWAVLRGLCWRRRGR